MKSAVLIYENDTRTFQKGHAYMQISKQVFYVLHRLTITLVYIYIKIVVLF